MERPLNNRGKALGSRLLSPASLLGLFVWSMGSTETAVFLVLQFVRGRALVLRRGIISPLALGTSQSYDLSHGFPLLRYRLQKEFTPRRAELPFFHGSVERMGHGPTYSRMSEMTPAPTVRPPSRIANRNSFSIAIGVINSTVNCTLSPGITISTPEGNVTTPVTSVVRK